MSYIFTGVAKPNIKTHLPIIADFWESVLHNKTVYHNNTMRVHLGLNDKIALTARHFEIWLNHFNNTIDELFAGEIALLAKQRATSVATVMQIKLLKIKSPERSSGL